MKVQLIAIFFLFSIKSFAQRAPEEDTTAKFHRIDAIHKFVDSIRSRILSDTSKFYEGDVINSTKGRVNKNSYSPLFFINILYKYKLDIVKPSDVLAFLNEILVANKIESITFLEESKSMEIFGPPGKNGTIMLQMKDISKINLLVAGFKPIRAVGDNFH